MTSLVREQRDVFVDSSAWFGYSVANDAHHEEALAIMARIQADRTPIVTSNFVIAEAHSLLVGRLNSDGARRFLTSFEGSSTAIIRATEADEARARDIIFRYTDKAFSMVDAISFAIMDRLGLRAAFAFDRNFSQYGLRMLRP